MVEVHQLGFYSIGELAALEIAGDIGSKIRELSFNPEDFLYRGFGSNLAKLERLLHTGTDRCMGELEAHSRELIQLGEEEISLERARHNKHPRRTYLSAFSELPFSVGVAIADIDFKRFDFGAVSVYDSNGVRRISPT